PSRPPGVPGPLRRLARRPLAPVLGLTPMVAVPVATAAGTATISGRLEVALLPGVAPAAQVPLELARDGVAGRLGQVGGVLGLFQRPHVLGDVGVLLRELVDAALPGPG